MVPPNHGISPTHPSGVGTISGVDGGPGGDNDGIDDVIDDVIDDEDETSLELKQRRESETRLKRRHYKKDSRFLLDLYTLTFDEDQVSCTHRTK